MSSHTEDNCGSVSADNNNGHGKLPACACCMALARVRMPFDYDAAMLNQALGEPATVPSNRRRTSERAKKPAKSIFELFKGNGNGTGKSQSSKTGRGQDTDSCKESPEEWNEEIQGPKPRRLWQGLDGIAVMLFGMVLPLISMSLMCLCVPKRLTLVLLSHPLETLTEMALIAAIPIANYLIWGGICKNRVRFARMSSLALGGACGAALFMAGICISAMFMAGDQLRDEIGTDFAMGFCWISLIAVMAAAASGYLLFRLRATRDFANSKRQVIIMGVVGCLLSLVAFAGAESLPWYIRYVEHMAASPSREEAQKGLALLRQLNPERELRMECSDTRAAGIPGLFIPVKQSSEHDLYFALTGKPYSYRDFKNTDLSSMPDDYLSRNVVGELVKGLELSRSTLTGTIHPRTLTATMQWTLVLKNDTTQPQEARGELALPPGAVITGLTKWSNGEPDEARFLASGKAEGAVSTWSNAGHDSTGMVTDLGHGRLLLHCYPIAAEEQTKVRVSFVVPLKPEGLDNATVPLPEFVASNFSLTGEHQMRLQSAGHISCTAKDVTQERTAAGEYILSGTLTEDELHKPKLDLKVAHENGKTIAAFDKLAVDIAVEDEKRTEANAHREQRYTYDGQIFLVFDTDTPAENQVKQIKRAMARQNNDTVITTIPPHYVSETVERVSAAAPSRLVVVVDGSASTGQYAQQVRDALAKLPAGIPTEMMIASQERSDLGKPVALPGALNLLDETTFIGGQNNLKTVVRAAERAGETKNGAVLWIHGPQPASNQDIFIMSPYVAIPKFYEMTLGSGDVDTVEFFKNHPEVGPFVQIPHNDKTMQADMTSFFERWSKNSGAYGVKLSQMTMKPINAEKLSEDESRELLVLQANQRCRSLCSAKQYERATLIAVRYGFVSPVSCALIEASSHGQGGGGSGTLQGATNGTIGPTISGINTAGTVRVNNLANVEALLNIMANMAEVVLGIGGLLVLLHGITRGNITADIMGQDVEITAGQRIVVGAIMLITGLVTPGMINWFVASARDANLFS